MSCYLRLWRAPSYEKAWTESPRGSPPLLRLLPHLSPEANPCKPGGRPSVSRTKEGLLESPPVARGNAVSCPGTGECRSFQGARGFGARVLRGHSLKGRAQTSTLATPRYDQPGMRTSFQALGGIPAPRPVVRPPAGPMLSTGGQYFVKKREKAVPKRYVRGSEDPETWLGLRKGS